jgi:hypothetical protein
MIDSADPKDFAFNEVSKAYDEAKEKATECGNNPDQAKVSAQIAADNEGGEDLQKFIQNTAWVEDHGALAASDPRALEKGMEKFGFMEPNKEEIAGGRYGTEFGRILLENAEGDLDKLRELYSNFMAPEEVVEAKLKEYISKGKFSIEVLRDFWKARQAQLQVIDQEKVTGDVIAQPSNKDREEYLTLQVVKGRIDTNKALRIAQVMNFSKTQQDLLSAQVVMR